jgi:hypothetical protein
MSEARTVLEILLEERVNVAPSVPEDLVRDILGIEERVQFDEDRRAAVGKIGTAVQVSLDKESLKGPTDEHAS